MIDTVSHSNTMRVVLPTARSASDQKVFPQLFGAETLETVFAYISDFSGGKTHTRKPFIVRVDPDEEGFIATSPISLVYEMGTTWHEALRNYLQALMEHFEWLVDIEHSLSASIQDELLVLREYLRTEE
jgi:hypothetical protein